MTLDDILAAAQHRAEELRLPYAGALTPREAYDLWRLAAGARLVDVRTRAELEFVGRIPGAVEIEFLSYPGNARNPRFLDELEQRVERAALLMFLCRSGNRSHHAAALAAQAGYTSYNVLEGFEGERDEHGHRGTRGGWRFAGLPWTQS